jgi:AcrR family transcriptional regulator
MQRPDPAKRREILEVAARLFASKPFHEVRLEDVASAAHIGKGTIYIYFESKETMYLTLIREGFTAMVESLKADMQFPASDVWTRLGQAADGLIRFAAGFPDLFRVLRSGVLTAEDPELQSRRRELALIVEDAIRLGNKAGQTSDPAPELTAQFLLSFVRGAMLYPPPGMTPESLKSHLLHVLRRGIGVGAAA